MNCFMSKAHMQMMKLQVALQRSDINSYFEYDGSYINDADLPVCDLMTIGLGCFDLKECLSDQESKYVANLIVTLYKVCSIF